MFNGVFGKMFSGEAADGMYSGGSVDISSNIVNVDFKGIAGDNEEVFGLMNMTKKDGTAFFEGDAKEYFVVSDQQNDGVNSSVTCTRSLSDQISAKLFYHADSGIGSMMYNVVDNNTIEAIFGYSDTEFNIIGETLSFNEDHVTLYHIDETFMTGKEYFETFNEHSDKNDPFWSDGLNRFILWRLPGIMIRCAKNWKLCAIPLQIILFLVLAQAMKQCSPLCRFLVLQTVCRS